MPSDFYSPEHVQQLVSALSTGIVSLDVRLEVERVPVDTLGHHVSKDLVEAVAVPNLSLRKIGLFMRLTAVEGKKFKHTSNMYAPIVQLMVASNGPDGKIHTVNTLSVAGKPARGALAATPSRQKSAAKNTTIKQQLQEAAHRASREGPLSGLRDLWGSLMHQPKPKKPCADNKKKKPALSAGDRIKGLRKGKALAGHNPHRFPTAEESYRSQKQRKQDHAGLVKSACRRFTQTFFSTWSDGVVFVAVLMLLWVCSNISCSQKCDVSNADAHLFRHRLLCSTTSANLFSPGETTPTKPSSRKRPRRHTALSRTSITWPSHSWTKSCPLRTAPSMTRTASRARCTSLT